MSLEEMKKARRGLLKFGAGFGCCDLNEGAQGGASLRGCDRDLRGKGTVARPRSSHRVSSHHLSSVLEVPPV